MEDNIKKNEKGKAILNRFFKDWLCIYFCKNACPTRCCSCTYLDAYFTVW